MTLHRASNQRNLKAILASVFLLFAATPSWGETPARVGMILWAGCEDICRGVRDHLANADPTIEFLTYDAARDEVILAKNVEIAKHADLDLLITWGTRVTRATVGTIEEFGQGSRMGDTPVIFTVVADPVGARIIESYEVTGRKLITGTRNRVPEAVNISGLRRVMPAFNHLGLIYETEAANSRLKFEELQMLSGEMEFTLTASPLTGDDETKLAQMKAALVVMQKAGVQFIYLGSSTFLETYSDVFTRTAIEMGLPILSPYENLVRDSNAYMSIAARDYDLGHLAAERALEILTTEKPAGEFPVVAMEEFAFVLNASAAKELQFFPPIDMLQIFEMVND